MSENHSEQIRIHIDRKPYESPSPTTGSELYKLGGIGAHRELFREVEGNHEDEPVSKDEAKINLKKDEHFYSEKDFDIVVNGRKKEVTSPKLSFDELVKLAFDNPAPGPKNWNTCKISLLASN